MSNLELRIEEEANLGLTISDSSDMSFDAVDFVGVPFAPTVEVEDIEGGHRVSITSMGAEGKKTDEFDVMDGADGATGPQGPKGDSYEITAADYAEIAEVVEGDIQDVIDAAQDAADDATAAAAEARAASAATWLNGNVLFGELAEGTVLTADDAFATPPKGVEVYGKSTQSGTPTPDAPVPILSVDDLTLHVANATKRAYFNQMRAPQDGTASGTYNGVSYVRNADGSIDIGGTATAQVLIYPYVFPVGEIVFGHKYLIRGTSPMGGSWETYYGSMGGVGGFDYGNGSIYTNVNYNSGTSTQMRITVKEGATIPQTKLWPQLFDLTLMFGEGNEPATVAEFEEMFPDTYYPYNDGTWNDAPNWPITIPLSDHIARSLPDGTRDTLTLSYMAPSTEHDGWGVFGAELVQNVWEVDLGTLTWGYVYATSYPRFTTSLTNQVYPGPAAIANALCTAYVAISQNDGYSGAKSMGFCINGNGIWLWDQSYTDAEAFKAAMSGTKLIYPLATPITTDLGTIELPILPNPLTAWADGGSAQPTLALEYERALSIVIPRIEAQLADMVTS